MKKTALLALAALSLWMPSRLSSESKAEPGNQEYSLKFRKGGSFSVEPALMIPSTSLAAALENTLGYNINFDIGASADFSVALGLGYYDMRGKRNPDFYMVLAPMWAGIKSKNQFLPMAEVYWEADAALFYERAYLVRSSRGQQENMDPGGILGAGIDVWWTRWLLTGFEARAHVIIEDGQAFPFMQLGLRIGVRG